uniref:(California timema) hypothetical protein n=1 Tax=Timema californicum TaxID=61474 RepID=A0A7R9P7D4_TIMCA|nr:unnamed protein product [Timema californicum]
MVQSMLLTYIPRTTWPPRPQQSLSPCVWCAVCVYVCVCALLLRAFRIISTLTHCCKFLWHTLSCLSVGYTMRDIRYKWNEGPNSVGVSNEVSLPQFKVLGHRQRAMEISLTTGK